MANNLDYKLQYRRNLPHIQPEGATFFVTTRLYGSLPESVLQQLHAKREQRLREIAYMAAPDEVKWVLFYDEEKRHFGRYDALLDRAADGPTWLRDPRVAAAVCEAIHWRDGKMFDLEAYCVMSNHVHLVFTPLEKEDGRFFALSRIMHGLKGYTGSMANEILEREGPFWQTESYDHYTRTPDELQRILRYVLNNPVQAGLASAWDEWSWTYWKHAPPLLKP